MAMTGETIKTILEDVADNLFNPDPYYQQGGDMVRVGGMGYTVSVDAAMGSRIANMHLLRHGRADRGREGLRGGGLGLGQRGHRRARPSGMWSPLTSRAAQMVSAAAAQAVKYRPCRQMRRQFPALRSRYLAPSIP